MEKYRVEKADVLRDRSLVLDFWQRAGFSSPDRAERYNWFYLDNPSGPGRIYTLIEVATGAIVGTACAGTRSIRVPTGRVLRASVLVDFVVDPAHRSVGPAIALQRAARESELLAADLLYGLPDTKAVPVFRRLGAERQFWEGNYSYVVRTATFIARRLPYWARPIASLIAGVVDPVRSLLLRISTARSRIQVAWVSGFPEALDDLWRRSGGPSQCGIGIRDREYLRWRFSAGDWQLLIASNAEDGRIVAYWISRNDGDDLVVADIYLPGETDNAAAATRALLEAAQRGVRVIRVELAGGAWADGILQSVGFVRRSERPCFVIRSASLSDADFPEDWWFTRADEDV